MQTRVLSAGLLVAAALLALPILRAQEEGVLPGDARRGAQLFKQHRCVECHSFRGEGGKIAPDLGRRSARDYTPAMLSAVMWNHAPTMWKMMEQKGITVPALSGQEVADLFAHFYSIQYFEKPGDAAEGKKTFEERKCSRCHALRGDQPSVGPAVVRWEAVADPIEWAAKMWNHSAGMYDQMKKDRVSWPRLSGEELSDLLVYLKNLPETRSAQADFRVANAKQGEQVFGNKGCGNCHTLGTAAPGKINLLARGRTSPALLDFVAAMWNHAPDMHARATSAGVATPKFGGSEMNDLVGYLFWTRYFQFQGNPAAGRRVFVSKGCVTCHEMKAVPSAPDLSRIKGQVTPVFMGSTLWKHGPKMYELLKQQGRPWPQFTGAQMLNLIAYLNGKS